MITLNSKAQLTFDIIVKVAERKITISNATKLLSKSRRTINAITSVIEKRGCSLLFMVIQVESPRIKRRIQ